MTLKNIILYKIALLVITVIFATVYGAVQQSLRQGANDPQIQLAEDAVAALNAGQDAQGVVGSNRVDLQKSLAPFVIVYDESKAPLATGAVLNGAIPTLPSGVFDYAKEHSENRVTWQPQDGVRIAAVVRPFDRGYVVAGRSLREVENRERTVLEIVVIGWALTLLLSVAAVVVRTYHRSKR